MSEAKTIHWSEQLGNPFLTGIDPRMLEEEGYELKTTGRCKGMSKFESRIPLIVKFDRNYVIEVIKRNLLDKLTPTSYNEFQKILSEAWKKWKN